MLVISGSLPKSGSTWLYRMTDAALVAAGYRSTTEVRDRYRLNRLFPANVNEFGYATPQTVLRLLPVHARNEAVLFKTHYAPSRSLRAVMRLGMARGTYVYRDLRDVALSAKDHGTRAREGGHPHELGSLRTVEDAFRYTAEVLLPEWRRWRNTKGLLLLQYEQMLQKPKALMRDVVDHLDLPLPDKAVSQIVDRYSRKQMRAKPQKNLYLNKGTAARHRQELSPAQRDLAKDLFGEDLEAMGYAA